MLLLIVLPLSQKRILDDNTDKVYAYINERYDVLIVGSDAIWNYITRGFGNAYLPDKTVTCLKMSYAASCYGMDFLTHPESEREKIGYALNDFGFIGVRDSVTEEFVRWSGCDIAPVHTCDPTTFLDVNDLPIDEETLCKKLKKRGFDFSKPTIGMMGTPDMLKMLRRMYGNKYQIVALDTEFAKVHTPKTFDLLGRLGFSDWYFKTDYKTLNIEAMKRQADKFLTGNYSERILSAVDNEAESFNAFYNAFKQLTGNTRLTKQAD